MDQEKDWVLDMKEEDELSFISREKRREEKKEGMEQGGRREEKGEVGGVVKRDFLNK